MRKKCVYITQSIQTRDNTVNIEKIVLQITQWRLDYSAAKIFINFVIKHFWRAWQFLNCELSNSPNVVISLYEPDHLYMVNKKK